MKMTEVKNAKSILSGKFGFTLIELLVVLTIIGLLLAVSLAIFTDSRARARDSRRVSDIDALQKALALYLSMADQYPQVAGPPGEVVAGSDTLSNALAEKKLLTGTIVDPRNGQSAGGSDTYEYRYYSGGNSAYTITYCTETSAIRPLGCGHSVLP